MEVHSAVFELSHVDGHVNRRKDSREYMVFLIGAFLQIFLANTPKGNFFRCICAEIVLFPLSSEVQYIRTLDLIRIFLQPLIRLKNEF
jgi:hypothetical protein